VPLAALAGLAEVKAEWIASVRVFRQTAPGDWGGVADAAMAALRERLRG
jgi:hypothetical protein